MGKPFRLGPGLLFGIGVGLILGLVLSLAFHNPGLIGMGLPIGFLVEPMFRRWAPVPDPAAAPLKCLICGLLRWLFWLGRLGRPKAGRSEQASWMAAWDYRQVNDWEVWERDPARDEMEAISDTLGEDRPARFAALLALAQRGSAWSMRLVASCYWRADGVEEDLDQAETWCRRSIEAGCQRAQLELGYLHRRRRNFEACAALFADAAAAGWAPAQYWVAFCRLRQDWTAATYRAVRPLLEAAANAGNPNAMALIGFAMITGLEGVRRIPAGIRYLVQVVIWIDKVRTWEAQGREGSASGDALEAT
ncbi:MAG: hypothetical protein JWM33_231 [Caulobacteraceae bacterium]|nr:hypothetical protein [Caulobacteraceae bacterium]